jgi:chromosome segregation ATPase
MSLSGTLEWTPRKKKRHSVGDGVGGANVIRVRSHTYSAGAAQKKDEQKEKNGNSDDESDNQSGLSSSALLVSRAEMEERLESLQNKLSVSSEEATDLTIKVDKLELEVNKWRALAEQAERNEEMAQEMSVLKRRNKDLLCRVEEYEASNKENARLVQELSRRMEVLGELLTDAVRRNQKLEDDLVAARQRGGADSLQSNSSSDSLSASSSTTASKHERTPSGSSSSSSTGLFGWRTERRRLQEQVDRLTNDLQRAQMDVSRECDMRRASAAQVQSLEQSLQTAEQAVARLGDDLIDQRNYAATFKAARDRANAKLKRVERDASDAQRRYTREKRQVDLALKSEIRRHKRAKQTIRALEKKIDDLQYYLNNDDISGTESSSTDDSDQYDDDDDDDDDTDSDSDDDDDDTDSDETDSDEDED